MKKNYINILLLVATAYTFEGCWGLGGNGSGTGYNYSVTNTDKYIRARNYKEDHPFQMRDEGINVPLVSKKGQVKWNTNFAHGINSSFALGLSDKIFIQAGGTITNSHSLEQKTGSFEVTNYSSYNNNYSSYTNVAVTHYDLNYELEGSSYNLGIGFYKNFAKNGRWNYFAGYANGSTSSKYTYSIPVVESSSDRTYSFEETRRYYQLFLQTDFGYETNTTEGAIVARTSYIHFTEQEFNKNLEIPGYEMQSSEFVFQPALHFAVGNTFKLFTQCGWNIPLGKSQVKWFSTNVQAGIILNFKAAEKF